MQCTTSPLAGTWPGTAPKNKASQIRQLYARTHFLWLCLLSFVRTVCGMPIRGQFHHPTLPGGQPGQPYMIEPCSISYAPSTSRQNDAHVINHPGLLMFRRRCAAGPRKLVTRCFAPRRGDSNAPPGPRAPHASPARPPCRGSRRQSCQSCGWSSAGAQW